MLPSAAAAAALVFAVWLVSLRLGDVFWGLGFVLIGWLCFGLGDGARVAPGGRGHGQAAYSDYIARTSGFVPLPPRRIRSDPSAP